MRERERAYDPDSSALDMQEKSIVKLGFLFIYTVCIYFYLPKANTTYTEILISIYIYWSQRPPTPKPTRLPAEKHRYCEEVLYLWSLRE